MRLVTPILLVLPVLAFADDQAPLLERVKGWLSRAQSYLPSSIPLQSPAATAAAKAAEHQTTKLTLENWKSVLTANPRSQSNTPEEWMVLVTGGTLTCSGRCGNVTRAWNVRTPLHQCKLIIGMADLKQQTVPILSLKPSAPNLALLDCEEEQVLCSSWLARPSSLWHMFLPRPLPDQSKPATTVRIIPLNRTDVTSADIFAIHTKELYKNYPVYEGMFHPFDGWLQRIGLAVPVGHVLYWFSKLPSWVIMVGMSFVSRLMM